MANRRARAFQTLRHRDFRLLWIADSVSLLGTRIQDVAIAFHIWTLTGDAFQLGLIGLFRFVPALIFGLFGGVVADQQDRRKILILTHLALMMTSAVLAVATITGNISMPLIYGVTFVSATLGALAGPARQALIPALVPRTELAGAATIANLAMQTASVVGPAVGGVLIDSVGLAAAYTFDAMSFVAVIVAALLIRARDTIVAETATRGLGAIREGLAFLWATPILLAVMALDFVATFFGAGTTLMPIFAEEVLDMGANGLGILLSAPAAGAVIGSLVMSAAPMPNRPGLGIVVAILAYGACIVGFGLSTAAWLSILFLAGSGAADAVSMALRHAIRNLVTPNHYRGRIAAAHSTFARGGPQLGEFRAGAIASLIGAPLSIALGGMATIVCCLVMVHLVPGLHRYTTDELPSDVSDHPAAARHHGQAGAKVPLSRAPEKGVGG